jgi:O-acetylhomoserine (thiol)-lyase
VYRNVQYPFFYFEKKMKRSTMCVQSGWTPKNGEPRVLPIYQSTTFKYDDSEKMARLFDLKEDGYFYTRLANPTNDCVARKIAELEGGVGAVLTSSGQAASFFSVFNVCEAGDHLICSQTVYGGTYNLFGVTMKKLGIDCTFINQDWSDEEIEAAFRPNTKCFFGETLSNPGVRVFDIERFARIAHRHGVPLIVDNTFATPINCRPFEWGADIVTHSTTKYMDGHALTVGGVIVDSGNFDWDAYGDKFAGLTRPDESYHGITYTRQFGRLAYITKIVAQLMRDLGSIPSPMNAFLLNIGLETLHLRMPQHCRNARAAAEFLLNHPRVAWVHYPDLKGDANYDLAQKYMPQGTCGVMSFGLKGTREDAVTFMDRLRMIAIVTHVADARSCVLHPASHTHRQMSDAQLRAAGIEPDLIRFSAGIEDCEDILADLRQALE